MTGIVPPGQGRAGDGELAEALRGIDPDHLTPRQALEALYKLRALLPVASPHERLT